MSNGATNECKDSLTEQLYQLACEFLEGIDRCDKSHFPERALAFPRGVCGHVTRLLGSYLEDMGLGKSVHVSGIRTDEKWYGDHTHAWLELQGIIVDITASQFEAVTEPVIVTRHSAWHDLYTVYQRQEGTYRSTDFNDIRMVYLLDTIYWEIIRTINPNHELLERREQLTVQKTLPPHIDGWALLRQQRVAADVNGDAHSQARYNSAPTVLILSDPIGVERLLSPGSVIQWIRSEPPQWSQIGHNQSDTLDARKPGGSHKAVVRVCRASVRFCPTPAGELKSSASAERGTTAIARCRATGGELTGRSLR